MNAKKLLLLTAIVAASAIPLGCRDWQPHSFAWPAGGDVSYTHPKPPEGGYYGNWDPYAATIEIDKVEAVNPVGTQHILVATVKDHEGKPLPNRRVEWIIPEGSVGAFVEVDESGWRNSRGYKMTNNLAVTHTNNGDHVLTRGNDNPNDDVHLKKGQTWAVITSAAEGTTHVVAYAPGIYDWKKHKVFAKKHWYDVKWMWPNSATNPIGTTHDFNTRVTTYSDDKPIKDYEVTYKIVSGPDAVFEENGKDTLTVKTNGEGIGGATLKQVKPAEGTNKIKIDVTRPEDKQCCRKAVHLATGTVSKTWVGPRIDIRKTAPDRARVGEQFTYNITVTNPGKVKATNAVLTDNLPDGIAYVSSSPEAQVNGKELTWNLGTINPGQSVSGKVQVRATRTGTLVNPANVKADYGLSDKDDAQTVVAEAALKIEKEGPDEVLICDPITYRITVTNTGSATARDVKLVDQLPDGLSYKGGRKVEADFGDIAPGKAKRMTYTVSAEKTGTFTNKVTVEDGDGHTQTASVKTVVRQPVLVINKEAPKERYAKTPVTYTLTVTNKGDGVATGTVVTDTLPKDATFRKASDNGKQSGGKVTWQLGDIKPNASKEVTVTVVSDKVGTLENFASVTAKCTKASGKASTEIVGIPAILLECVDTTDPIAIGENETYVITVTNQGTAMGTGIVITTTLPKEMDFVSADGPTKHTVDGKKVTFKALEVLNPKKKATYKVITKGTGTGDLRFQVTLKSDQMTSQVRETESTHVYDDSQ
ncbi:MAG: isopeptide-forming domain-containing fimbrial protein [Phycisphaerae bacterium]